MTDLSALGQLTGRALRREFRQIDGLIVGMALPVLIMTVFVVIFGGAISTGSSSLEYVDFVVPAVLLISAGYGAALTAVSVNQDMTGGMLDRFRALPIRAWAVPMSHVMASAVRNLVAAGFALGAALALGFRPQASVVDWLLVFVVVVSFIVAVSAIGVVWGLWVKSAQAAGAIGFAVLFLPYVSDGFVPAETMPSALRGFAEHQPFTPVIETMRALMLDGTVGSSGWLAVMWLAIPALASVPMAALLFRRRASV